MKNRLELLNNTQLFVLDMDGTFYLSENILPGALDFLSAVKESGRDFLFFTNNSSKTPDEYEANLRKMIEMTLPKVKGMFILSPYYMEPNKNDPMRARMDDYGAVCKKLAGEYGCTFVDLQAMFDKYFKHRHSSFIAWDRIHPNQVGATVIAREFLSHCGFDPMHEYE